MQKELELELCSSDLEQSDNRACERDQAYLHSNLLPRLNKKVLHERSHCGVTGVAAAPLKVLLLDGPLPLSPVWGRDCSPVGDACHTVSVIEFGHNTPNGPFLLVQGS